MKRWRIVGLVALVIGIAALVWVCRPQEREPVYKGKALSYWLKESERHTPQQSKAILTIGTNALPFLIKWIQYMPRGWEIRLVEKAPAAEALFKRRLELVNEALDGFKVLGACGSNAVPALRELLRAGNSTSATMAIYGLEFIGGPAVPVLMEVVTNQVVYSSAQEWPLAGTMFVLGTNSELMIPGLLDCLQSPDQRVVVTGIELLAEIRREPTAVVPALVACAQSTNQEVRCHAVRAFEQFKGQAQEAVPTLLKALNDCDRSVRVNATNALGKIAPEVLGKRERQ